MKRRDFLKQASMAALATRVVPLGAAGKRIAFGGIQTECSAYGNILSRMEDFTIRRGQALADYRQLRSPRQPEPPSHRQPRHAVGVPDRAAHRPRSHAQARVRHARPLPR
jgi:hypothetical protein